MKDQKALHVTVDINDSLQQALWQMQLSGDEAQLRGAIGSVKAAARGLTALYRNEIAPAKTQHRSPM